MGVIRGTYEDPTQMMDSLKQLHDEWHLKTFFPEWTDGINQSNIADITAHCLTVESIFPGWFACGSPEKKDLSSAESCLQPQLQH